jgi:PAS domain S-box-containing protein
MSDEKKTKAQLVAELEELRSRLADGGGGLESLCDVIPQGVFRCDADGAVTWANRSLARMLGRDDPGGVVGVKLRSLLAHPRRAKGLFDSLKSGEGARGYEAELKRADGGTLRASLTLEPRPAAGGRTVFDGLAEDLADAEALERRERQSAVLAALSRELFTVGSVQEVLDAAVARLAEIFPTYSSVNLVEEDGRYLVVRAYRMSSAILRFGEKLTGRRLRNWKIPLDCESVIARTIRTGHPTVHGLDFEPDSPVNEADVRMLIEALVEEKNPLRRFAAPIAEKFGDAAYLGIPFTDSAGRVTGSITVMAQLRFGRDDFNLIRACSDIVGKAVEQKLLADELRASGERFRGVFENTVIGIYRTTPAGRVLMANPALVRMLGYDSFEELQERDLAQGYQAGHSRADFIRAVEKTGELRGLESVWKRLDGSSLHVRENARAVRDAKGKTLYYEGTVEDVTERIEAQERLSESEQRYRFLVEQSYDVFYRVNLGDESYAYLSPAMKSILGFTADEFIGMAETGEVVERIHPDDLGWLREDAEALRDNGRGAVEKPVIEYRLRHADGEYRWLSDSRTVVFDEAGKATAIVGVTRDVTERKLAEERLRESEELYRTFTEEALVGVYIFENGRFVFVNPRMEEITGYPREELLAMDPMDIVLEEDRRGVLRERSEARVRGEEVPNTYRMHIRRKTGEVRVLELRAQRLPASHPGASLRFGESGTASLGNCVDITDRVRAEEESDRHLRELEALFGGVDVLLWSVRESPDGELYYERVNEAFAAVEGHTPEHYNGRPVSDLHPPDECARIRNSYAWARLGKVHVNEVSFGEGAGQRFFEIRLIPLADPDGGIRRFIGAGNDITERKLAEERLRESEVLYRTFTEESLVGVYIYSYSDDRLIFVNPRMEEISGYGRDELLGMNPWDLVGEEHRGMIREVNEALARGEEVPPSLRLPIRRKDGEGRVVELRARYLPSFGGGGSVILVNCVDITESVRAEEALRESEKRYRFLVENTNDLFYRVNLADESYGYLSPALVKILGYGVEQFVEMAASGELAKRIHPDDMAGVVADAEALRDNARGALENPVVEYRLKHADGEYRWLSDARTVVYDETGKRAVAIVGVSRDVTERKLAEEALRESEERYRVLSEEAIVGVYIYRDARFLYVNDEMARITGYTPEELLEMDTGELVHTESTDFLAQRDEARRSGEDVPSRYTMKIKRKDGETAVLLVGARPIPYGGRTAYLGNCFDITQSVRAEEALRESEERYRSLQDNIPVGVFRVTHSGRVVSVNPAFVRMFGYSSPDEMRGVGVVDLYASAARRDELLAELTEKDVVADFEAEMVRRDGSTFWVLINVRAVRDADGEIVFHDGILVDQSERRAAHEHLRQSEERYRTTLESMGDAIHVVDSDLRITLVNKRLVRWTEELGFDPDVVGKNLFKAFGFLPKGIRAEYRKVFSGGQTLLTEERTRIGEREFIAEVRKIPILKGDRVDRVVTVVRDVTQEKLNEVALRESEERYRSLQENIPVGIFRTTPEGDLLSANPALWDMLGYSSEVELKAYKVGDHYVHPGQRREFVETLNDRGFITDFEAPMKRKDGSTFWASLNATLVRDPRGRGRHIDGILENVTERKTAQEALRESEEFSRALIERSPLGVSVRDRWGRLLSCNEAWRRIWAIPEAEVDEDKTREREGLVFDSGDDYLSGWQDDVRRVYAEGGYLHIPEAEVARPRPGGASWVSQHFYALKDETGAVSRVVIITEDISDRKDTLVALARSEQTYKSLYETTLALADSTELTDVIAVIAEQATGLLDAQQCLFLLLDSSRRVLTPIYSTRPDYRDIIMGFEVPVGVGLSGKVAESGVGRYLNVGEVDDVSLHVEGTDEGEDSSESLISVPMFDGGKVLGVITLGKFTGSFSDADLARLSVFARQAEIAVKRTKNIEELAASERTYHSLYETTLALADSTDLLQVIEVIAKQASYLLDSRKCIVFLVDQARRVLKPIYSTREDYQEIFKDYEIPVGEGLSGHVARNGVGMFVNAGEPEKAISLHIPGTDEEADERESLVSVPMFDGERVLGVITIGKFDATFSADDLAKLSVFARQAEIAVKRTRKSEDLARSEETYRSLYETTLALADKTDPLKVIKVIADQASSLARASDCTVYRLDTGRGVLRPIYSNDPTASEEIMAFEIPLGEGVSGRAAQAGERVCINLGESDGISVHVPGTSEEVDLRESVLSVPMFDSGRVIGVITINKEDDVFTGEDVEKLSVFARQAEIAVLRAENLEALASSEETYHRLYDTTLTLADESDLYKIISMICDQATRLLDSIYCTYFTYDASREVLVPFYSNAPREREAILGFEVPLGMGLSGKVARERAGGYSNYSDPDRPVVHVAGTDARVDDVESVISEPVMDAETLLGVITIGSEGKLYDSGDLDKLSVFARLASIAIKRAQNRQALERSEETYRTLYETTMTLADESDLGKVLAKIADNARLLQDAHFCNILLFDSEEGVLTPIYTNAPSSRDEIMALRLPVGSGLGGKVAELRRGAYSNYCDPDRPVVHIEGTDDSEEHRESVLGEPIMDGDTLLGVFLIHALDRVFTDDDLAKVRVFARLTSVALKRSQYLEALEESEEKYRTLVEQATDGVVIVQDLRFVFVNTAMLAMSGYESAEMLGRGFAEFIVPEDRPRLTEYYERRMRGEEVPSIYEIAGIHKDGHAVPLELNVGLIQYAGAPADLVIVRDITERKRAEEVQQVLFNIANSINTCQRLDELYPVIHRNLARILDTTNFFIAFYDEDNHALNFPYFVDELDKVDEGGYVSAEKTNCHYVVRTGEALLADRKVFDELNARGEIITREELPQPLIWLGAPLKRGDEVFGVVAVQSYDDPGAYDAGDRELLQLVAHQIANAIDELRAEQALAESEERYRSIWTKSPVGICLSDRTGEVTLANPALSQMLGYGEGELVGMKFYDLIAPEEPGQVGELLEETLDTQVYQDKLSIFSGKPTELALLKKSGDSIPAEMNIDFITREGSIQYMISLVTDITERKKAEEALANYSADLEREVEAKTAQLQEARRYLREVIDASPDLVTVVDAEGRLEILNRAASAATGYVEQEVRGRPIGSFYSDRDRDTVADMTRRLDSGRPYTVRQVDMRAKDGSAITVELSVSPLVDEEGRFTGSVAVGRDIRELEDLRRALLRSEKLAATGKLAADIAHEVNNPLGIIKNYLQIARGDLDPEGEPYKTIAVIEEEVQRIARIISGLLDFYRPESAYLESTDVNQLVEDLLMLVGIQLEKMGISVVKDLQDDLHRVLVSPDQLRQVLLNLVANAQDAMPTGGTLSVRTRMSEGRVVISFSDSGVGIPQENLPYIFDPFFTTKGRKGTGLGLSVSYGIVQSFDGMMEAKSAPGEGTTFTISLPARED